MISLFVTIIVQPVYVTSKYEKGKLGVLVCRCEVRFKAFDNATFPVTDYRLQSISEQIMLL